VVHNRVKKDEQMTVLSFVALTALSGIIVAEPLDRPRERALRIPVVPDSRILRKVAPIYPLAAVHHRIQGNVWFSALIGKDGQVERLRLISGHPLLISAAREAAQQWIYRPASVGGVPVRVATVIQIQFALDPYLRPGKVADNRQCSFTFRQAPLRCVSVSMRLAGASIP
jgi:TonB family protein